jgi:hypothetical protein
MTRIVALFLNAVAVGCGREAREPAVTRTAPADPGLAPHAASGPDAACDSLLALGGRVLDIELRRTGERDDSGSTNVPAPGCELEGVCFGAEPADTATGS